MGASSDLYSLLFFDDARNDEAGLVDRQMIGVMTSSQDSLLLLASPLQDVLIALIVRKASRA